MEEELSHPLTLWKLHHTTIAIVRGWKLLLLHRRLLTATTAQDGDRVSTVCIAAAAPAAPCFARLIISPLVSQTRSSLFEFSKKESAHAETVLCASRLLAQDRLSALEVESQRRQSSVPVRRKQKLGAVSRLKLSTTAALLPS